MNSIITIGREFGSGGKEIGEKLASFYDVPFYDKRLISIASKESGISEDVFYENDEVQKGSFIYSLLMGSYSVNEGRLVNPDLPLNHKVFLAQFDAIKNIAEQGPCVIVGRCADYVLDAKKNLINIFISADMDVRIKRVLDLYDTPEKKVEEFIKKMDKKRSSYYKYYTDKKWGIANNYDLCVNINKIGIDNTIDLIKNFVEYKEKTAK